MTTRAKQETALRKEALALRDEICRRFGLSKEAYPMGESLPLLSIATSFDALIKYMEAEEA